MDFSEFQTRDRGPIYRLEIDDTGEQITVSKLTLELVGSISLRYIDDDEDASNQGCFHITNLSLDACKKQGVGRACLEYHRELFSSTITAGTADGNSSEDGSHLTGDGVAFIAKMRKEGIVQKERNYDYDDVVEDDD